MRFPRLEAAAANSATVLASLAIAYLAMQFVFFRFLLPDLPHDWKHPNETGYRLLGALVAEHLDDRPADPCDDRWPAAPP
jgi:hypothetical protein